MVWTMAAFAVLLNVPRVCAQADQTYATNYQDAASESNSRVPSSTATVKFGIDNLAELRFEPLRGKRVALVCNAASRTRFQQHTVDVFMQAYEVHLRSILVPESSDAELISAHLDAANSAQQPRVFTLSVTGRRPTRQMLADCDVVVIDLQDIGVRAYPTLATLYSVLDACAEYGIPVIVLDRPNPLGGLTIDGGIPDSSAPRSGFTAVPIPYVHGMTSGELALMINGEGWLSVDPVTQMPRRCELQVIKMRRWRRWQQWEHVRSHWYSTSASIQTSNGVRGIALLGLIGELEVISVGIGTDRPFELVGAPALEDSVIESCRQLLAGVGIETNRVTFTPTHGTFAGQQCRGFSLTYPLHRVLPYYTIGLELLRTLARTYRPMHEKLQHESCRQRLYRITGDRRLLNISAIEAVETDPVDEFRTRRQQYVIYP